MLYILRLQAKYMILTYPQPTKLNVGTVNNVRSLLAREVLQLIKDILDFIKYGDIRTAKIS